MSTPIPGPDAAADRARLILDQHGIRPTAQRLRVAEILLTAPRHLTAEQILASVRETAAGHVSKATVYNTLNLLSSKGILRAISLDPTRIVYDSTTVVHHHFLNEDTGELLDIDPAEVELARLPPLPGGTEASSVEVIIRVRRRP